MLPRDTFLSLSEEAVAAACNVEVGQKFDPFVKMWASDNDCFKSVKEQFIRMPSSTQEQWKEKIGIESSETDEMEIDSC